jgi:Lysophospholipase
MNILTTKSAIALQTEYANLSGLYAAPASAPRALIVALHGGSVTSRIFDDTIPGEASFVDIAASLGFATIALDRPGYGASAQISPDKTTFDGQIAILQDALKRAWELYGANSAGIFLTGNSIGGMIALCLAAADLELPVLGVSTHGAGLAWLPGFVEQLQSLLTNTSSSTIDPRGRSTVVYGPAWSWDHTADTQLQRSCAPAPIAELRDALTWPERLRQIGALIHVPVHITIAEYDDRWSSAPNVLHELSQLFPAAPFVDIRRQRFVGHQLCVNFAARAFYLHELAFVEECRVQKLTATTRHRSQQ